MDTSTDNTSLNWLISRIRVWANDRNLITGTNSQAQLVKLMEEVGELAGAVARKDSKKVKDGIGDAIVVLTILATQQDLTIRECVEHAYEEIKDRKGRVIDGIFVKEEDLPAIPQSIAIQGTKDTKESIVENEFPVDYMCANPGKYTQND